MLGKYKWIILMGCIIDVCSGQQDGISTEAVKDVKGSTKKTTRFSDKIMQYDIGEHKQAVKSEATGEIAEVGVVKSSYEFKYSNEQTNQESLNTIEDMIMAKINSYSSFDSEIVIDIASFRHFINSTLNNCSDNFIMKVLIPWVNGLLLEETDMWRKEYSVRYSTSRTIYKRSLQHILKEAVDNSSIVTRLGL